MQTAQEGSDTAALATATIQNKLTKTSEWEAGEARYNNGMTIPSKRPAMADDGLGSCGLVLNIDLPKSSACSNCHNSMSSSVSIEHTPTQTAGYSNKDLIEIFTQGAKPAGGTFTSPFLRAAPMPDCLYRPSTRGR